MNERVKLPVGYHIDWAGEYESQKRSQHRLMIVLPLTILGIFVSLYAMFSSAKWALLILANVAMAPVGGLLALLFTGIHFSVSSAIMMTMLVATLGLLPAAVSRGIGSDSQRPFAIVIVGGLVWTLLLSIFLLPTLYVWVAKEGDKLPEPDTEFEERS